jgi:hypothetical protein
MLHLNLELTSLRIRQERKEGRERIGEGGSGEK